jgi:hypothetical protein
LFDIQKKLLIFQIIPNLRWSSGLQTVFYLLGGLIGLYLLFTLVCTYFVQQLPRNPVSDLPDWGRVTGAIIAASRNPNRIRILFLEASYAYTKEALLSLYRWFNSFFGICFGPMILFWMNL